MLLVEKFMRENDDWEELLKKEPYRLRISKKYGYVLLTYKLGKSVMSNPIVQECRGVIFDLKTLKPVCVPFFKFFNYGEPNAHELDWDSVKYYKKLDGSLMKLWCHNKIWHGTNIVFQPKDK